MMNKFLTLLQAPTGDLSMKRLYGLWCLIAGTVALFTIKDAAIIAIPFAAASAVFIAQAISKT